MARMEMTWDEVRRRMKNGATVKTLAELNGVSEQTVYNFIKKNKDADAGITEVTEEEEKNVKDLMTPPKLMVDQDVYEEVNNIVVQIDNAIKEYQDKIETMKGKREQIIQILDRLGVKS